MIAVRGTIRHKGDRRSSPLPHSSSTTTATTASTTAASSSTSIQFNPLQDTKPGEWIWNGFWAFGSLPPAEVLDSIGHHHGHKKKKPPAGVRPFVYKFQAVKDAKDVIVPSSLLYAGDDDDDDDEGVADNDADNADNADGTYKKNDNVTESTAARNETTEVEGSMDKDGNDKHENKEEDKQEGSKLGNESMSSKNNNNNMEVEQPKKDTTHNEEMQEPQSQNDDKDVDEKDEQKEKDSSSLQPTVIGEKPSIDKDDKNDKETKSTLLEQQQQQQQQKPLESNDQKKENKDKSNNDRNLGETFAETGEGSIFTDGGIQYPKRCPIGGCWKGYFENVSQRKDRMSSRVSEVFHLFFNATPPRDARMKFIDGEQAEGTGDETKDKVTKDGGELPEGYIHVRGAGTNQFGTFEILGGYNLETGVLACQRIYVSTSESAETVAGQKKEDKEKVKGSPSQKPPARKSYFTRKRPPGSWRSGSHGAYDDDIYDTGTGRSNSGRKRQRTVSEGGTKVSISIGAAEPGAQIDNVQSTIPPSGDVKLADSLAAKVPSSIQESSKATEAKSESITTPPVPGKSITIPLPSSKRPSPGKSPSSRRPKSSPSISARSSSSINSSAYQIKIPRTGNPHDARWRAAHFIYFQRQTETTDSSTSSATTSAGGGSTTTNYVVYEGEMNFGKNLRDGRGVCLYNNGTIYEGEWKRNKEHGAGTLTTGDRKRIIYTGDWERGKMHGRGTYYYHMYSNIEHEGDSKNGGMYTGDFKENARHGVGTYTLPGGDTYSGDWRENVPCGKGSFTWSDGSFFDGMWKDGKRNGWGKLTSADGFEYEGNWKENAMEGRGRATYPNGSMTYDGMWLDGKRDGRGTIIFGNGAVYKGRFKEDNMEGQGTLKLDRNVPVPQPNNEVEEKIEEEAKEIKAEEKSPSIGSGGGSDKKLGDDWMIPIEFQSDIGRIHEKAGFTTVGE